MRLDKYLVERGFVDGRDKAKCLINESNVMVNGEIETKASYQVKNIDIVEAKQGYPYVGRGAFKLISAFDFFNICAEKKICADFGASTGGFSQVLLERGAKRVYCFDVGHDQLHPQVKNDPRVLNFEGINLIHEIQIDEKIDLGVMDLSFISVKKVLQNVFSTFSQKYDFICLIKPQFEVGKKNLGKKGIVTDKAIIKETLDALIAWSADLGYPLKGVVPSSLIGKEGNKEYFFYYSNHGQACDFNFGDLN